MHLGVEPYAVFVAAAAVVILWCVMLDSDVR